MTTLVPDVAAVLQMHAPRLQDVVEHGLAEADINH